jgi:DNA-binding MarR family transcriptional regulator
MKNEKPSVFKTLELIKKNWPEYWGKIVPETLMFFSIEEQLGKIGDQAAKTYGIQRGDFNVLFQLRAGNKDVMQTPTKIYKSLGLTSGGLTKILHRLMEKELVTRIKNPTDGRSTMVQITPEGEATLCDVLDEMNKRDQSFFSVLDKAERKLLKQLFKKLIESSG